MAHHQLKSSSHGLNVVITAKPEQVWKAIVEETSAWWPKDFVTSERTLRL